MSETYDDIAELFDNLAVGHQQIADLLRARVDADHADSNRALARAEEIHAEACRRAAQAVRGRKHVTKAGDRLLPGARRV